MEGFNLELGEAHFRKEGHQLETAAKQNRLLTSNILLLTTHPGNQSFIRYIKQHKLKELKWLGWLLFPPEHKTKVKPPLRRLNFPLLKGWKVMAEVCERVVGGVKRGWRGFERSVDGEEGRLVVRKRARLMVAMV